MSSQDAAAEDAGATASTITRTTRKSLPGVGGGGLSRQHYEDLEAKFHASVTGNPSRTNRGGVRPQDDLRASTSSSAGASPVKPPAAGLSHQHYQDWQAKYSPARAPRASISSPSSAAAAVHQPPAQVSDHPPTTTAAAATATASRRPSGLSAENWRDWQVKRTGESSSSPAAHHVGHTKDHHLVVPGVVCASTVDDQSPVKQGRHQLEARLERGFRNSNTTTTGPPGGGRNHHPSSLTLPTLGHGSTVPPPLLRNSIAAVPPLRNSITLPSLPPPTTTTTTTNSRTITHNRTVEPRHSAVLHEQDAATGSRSNGNDKDQPKTNYFYWSMAGAVCIGLIIVVGVVIGVTVGGGGRRNQPSSSSPVEEETDIMDLPQPSAVFPTLMDSIPASMQDPTIMMEENPIVAQAYTWLVQDPNLSTYQETKRLQRWVLAMFYYATNGGTSWNINQPSNRQWLNYDTDECDWYSTTWDTSACNSNQQYIHLNVVPRGTDKLVGSIPTEVALLTALQDLELPEQSLKGRLPSELGLLTAMTSIKLQGNQFSSNLPLEWMALTNLRNLNLEQNKLTGSLSTEMGQLSRLAGTFDLSENAFQGPLPTELARMAKLGGIDFARNAFTGTIPSQLGLMSNLNAILLQRNNLSGTIPSQLGNLVRLDNLSLAGNAKIVQNLPQEICQNTEVGKAGVQTSWCGDLKADCCFSSSATSP